MLVIDFSLPLPSQSQSIIQAYWSTFTLYLEYEPFSPGLPLHPPEALHGLLTGLSAFILGSHSLLIMQQLETSL